MQKKSISIRTRFFFIVSSICIALFFISYQISSRSISRSFSQHESETAAEHQARTLQTILSNKNYIISKTSDWGQWDDAFQYVKDKNKSFEKTNLQDTSIVSLNLDLFTFWNLQKNLIWGKNIFFHTESGQKAEPLKPNDIETIRNHQFLLHSNHQKDRRTAFLKLSDGVYLLASVPITSSDGESPARGYLLSGIKLDSGFFSRLSEQLKLKIELLDLGEISVKLYSQQLRQEKKVFVNDSDSEESIYTAITNENDKLLLVYKIKVHRSINLKAIETINTFLVLMATSGVLISLLIAFVVDRSVLRRLSKLSASINSIKKTGDINNRSPNLGNDEIGKLSQSFNEMLEEVSKLRAATTHNEKMASLGEMAGGIAHEINNPIAIVGISSSLIRKMISKGITDQSKYLRQLDDIDKTLDRIAKIISGLKNITRDTSNEEFTACTVYEIIDDALAVGSEKFKTHGVELRFDPKAPVFQTIFKCMRIQLSQVIFNLLNNAYDAVEGTANPWIEVAAEIKDNFLFIYVKDSGPGIPFDIQSKIFQPFFTTKEVGKGTGLGLSLSNSIVQRHKGSFYVDNECKNTCFVVKLPLRGN